MNLKKPLQKISGRIKAGLITMLALVITTQNAAAVNLSNVTSSDVLAQVWRFFYDYIGWIMLFILFIVGIYYIMRFLRKR